MVVRKIEYQKGEAREGGLIEGAELVDENMGKFLDWTGKKTGLKIQVAEGLKGNAEIDVNKGVMRVNPYSTEMTGAVGHELTHLIKQYDRKAYNRLQRLTIEAMMKAKGMTYEQLYAKYEAKYTEEVNSDYTVEDILEEITADGATAYINDADFAERLAREDRSLAQKIADFFREIADTLKAIIDKRGIRAVGKVMLYNEAQYRVAANTWYQALEKAGTRYKEGYTAVTDTESKGTQYQIDSDFEEQFDKWLKNPTTGVRFHFGTTSEALQSIGIKAQDIYMDSGKMIKMMNKHHEVSTDTLRQIPQILENPIIIMDSSTSTHAVTMFGDVRGVNGENIMVALELQPVDWGTGEVADYQVVLSAYTRNNLQNYIDKRKIYYIEPNKKRTEDWLTLNGLQLPVGTTHLGSIEKIDLSGEKNNSSNAQKDNTKFQLDPEFETKFDKWVSAGFSPRQTFHFGTTSKALQEIGVYPKDIYMHSSKMLKMLNDHPELDTSVLKQIPKILENPIIVMDSGTSSHAITMFGDVTGINGENIMVALEPSPVDKNTNKQEDFQIVLSAYERKNLQSYINRRDIYYIEPNKNKTNKWLSQNRLQLPLAITHFGLIKKIPQSMQKGNGESKKNTKFQPSDKTDSSGNALTDEQAESVANKKPTANEDIRRQLDIDDDPEQDFFANIVHDSNAETQKAADTLGQLLSLIDYMPSEKAIRRTAKRIKEYTATDTDIKEIESTLFNAFNFIANVDEIDGREWSSMFANYAGELISNSSKVEVDPVAEKLFRDFRNTIKNKVFHMPEGFDGEVKTLGGIRAIRSQSGMAINITKDKGPTIDTLYDELCTLYPGYFDKDITNPADQLEHIIDTYSSLKPKPVVSYATEEDYDAYRFASYVCIVAQRHRRINHIYHGGIKLRGALGSNNGFASIFLNLLPCFTGNSSAALCNLSISGKPLGVMHLGQFCSGSFSEHVKGELQSAHIIAEVFFLESFKPFIFACTHARPRLSYFIREYGVLFALLNAVLLPCVGQFLACPDREQALIYPVGIISLACISL